MLLLYLNLNNYLLSNKLTESMHYSDFLKSKLILCILSYCFLIYNLSVLVLSLQVSNQNSYVYYKISITSARNSTQIRWKECFDTWVQCWQTRGCLGSVCTIAPHLWRRLHWREPGGFWEKSRPRRWWQAALWNLSYHPQRAYQTHPPPATPHYRQQTFMLEKSTHFLYGLVNLKLLDEKSTHIILY